MPIAPSQYWPMVHGSTPEDVRQDEEGMQIMRMLGRNMAYMIRAFALARENGCFRPIWRSRKCAPTSSVNVPLLIRRMKRQKLARLSVVFNFYTKTGGCVFQRPPFFSMPTALCNRRQHPLHLQRLGNMGVHARFHAPLRMVVIEMGGMMINPR